MEIIINSNSGNINASLWDIPGSKKVLIVAPGIGVTRYFYRKFAEYFSNLNYSVITFDYVGLNSNDKLTDDVYLEDWGKKAIYSVVQFCNERYRGHQLFLVGHSIAGQLFPLADNCNDISSSCFVTSQNVSFQN